MAVRPPGGVRRLLATAAAALGAGTAALVLAGTAGAASPSLTISPAPSGGYTDGQSVSISVGPNSVFSPNARIEIIECEAPKGVLPIDDSTCDGNTAQGQSVLVGSNGAFTLSSYTIYELPNSSLAELPGHPPFCNATSECVLYIGQNQNDFTQPKIFSAPFVVKPGGPGSPNQVGVAGSGTTSPSSSTGSGSTANTGGTAPGTASGSPAAGASGAGVADPTPGSLAFTGPPASLPWLVAGGLVLIALGSAGRRLARRERR